MKQNKKDSLYGGERLEAAMQWTAVFFIIVGFVFIALFCYGTFGVSNLDISPDRGGQLGDLIGGTVGSLWALTGVLLFFTSLRLQRKDLRLQGHAIEIQAQELARQRFESTFFNLLDTQRALTNSLVCTVRREFEDDGFYGGYMYIDQDLTGHEIFSWGKEELARTIKFFMRGTRREYDEKENEYRRGFLQDDELARLSEGNDRAIIQAAYHHFFEQRHDEVGHYFRHLYHMLLFVDSYTAEGVSQKEILDKTDPRFEYAQFIQAQMPSTELFLLFYNGLCFSKLEKLINKYRLVENLAVEDLVLPEHAKLYRFELKYRSSLPHA